MYAFFKGLRGSWQEECGVGWGGVGGVSSFFFRGHEGCNVRHISLWI